MVSEEEESRRGCDVSLPEYSGGRVRNFTFTNFANLRLELRLEIRSTKLWMG